MSAVVSLPIDRAVAHDLSVAVCHAISFAEDSNRIEAVVALLANLTRLAMAGAATQAEAHDRAAAWYTTFQASIADNWPPANRSTQ